jgi:hypothetical protein
MRPVRRTPVETTAALARQLQILSGDPDRGDRLVAGLSRLGRDVAVAVPSCLAVSLVLVRCGGDIPISILACPADSATVLASLAVPLSAAGPGDRLILRAGEVGAFLLLSDDLGGRLGADRLQVEVDQHLSWPPTPTGEALAASLADLGAVNQGIGVLMDRGLPPEVARRELHRRADDADVTIGNASRLLLASLPPVTEPG